MMIRFVILFLAFNACVFFVKAQKPCDGVIGLKFRPDPQYCHVYHLCGNGKDMSFECGKNLLWNQDLSKCVPVGSASANCTKYNKWAANSPPPPRPPMASNSLRSSSEWRYNPFGESTWRPNCAPGSKQRFAHPTRCAQYYDCGANPREDWWGKHLRECPYPTLFDEKIRACGYYSNVNCGKRRLPIDPCDYLSNRCRTSHCVPCYIRFASCAGLRNGINPWRGREQSPFFVVCKQERVVFHGRCVSPEPGRRHVFSSRYNTCIRSLDRMAGKTPTIDFNNMYYSELPKISQQSAQSHRFRQRQQNANQYQPEPGPHELTKVGHHDIHPDFHNSGNHRTQPPPAHNTFSHNNGQQKHQPSHPQYKPHSQHSNVPSQTFAKVNHSPPNNNHPPKRNQFSQPPPNNFQGQPPNAGPAPQYPPYQKPHQPLKMSHVPPPNHGPQKVFTQPREPAPPAPITGQKSSPAQQHPKYNPPQSGQPPQYPPYERVQKPQPPAPKHQPYDPANSPPVRPPYEQPKAQPNPPKPISGPPPQKTNFQSGNPQANRPVHQMAAFEHKPQVNLPPQAPTTREQSRVTHSKASFTNNMNAPKQGPNYQNKFNHQQFEPANNYPRKQQEQAKWKPKQKTILSQGSWHQSSTNQISKGTPPQPKRMNPPPPPQNNWQQQPKNPQSPNRWQQIPHKTLAAEPIKHGSKPTPTSSFGPQTPPRRKEIVVQPVRREMIKKNTQPWNNQQHKSNYMPHHQTNTQNNIQKSPQMPNNQVPKHNHVQQRYDPNQKPVNKYQPPPPPQPPNQQRQPSNNAHNLNQRPPQNSFNPKMHHVPQNKPQNTFNHQPYQPPANNRPHHSNNQRQPQAPKKPDHSQHPNNRPHHPNNQRPPQAPKMPDHPKPHQGHNQSPHQLPVQTQNQNNIPSRSHSPHQHNPQSPPHGQKYQQPLHPPYIQNNPPAKAPIQHQGSNLQPPSTHTKQTHYQPSNMQQKQKPPMYQPQQQQQQQLPQHMGQNKPSVQPGPYKQQPPQDWRNSHNAGSTVVQEKKPSYQPNTWNHAGSLTGPTNNQPYQPRPQQPPVNYQPGATVNSKYPNQQHGQTHNRQGHQNSPHNRNEPSPPTSPPQYHYRPTKSAQFSDVRNNGQGNFNNAFERRV